MATNPPMEKRLEAETVTLLKSLLEMELRRVRTEFGFDVAMLVGVDGRIFASSIPDRLAAPQYRLLNVAKANLPSICVQLMNEAMTLSLTQYEYGIVVVSPVGARAFLVLLSGQPRDVTAMGETIGHVRRASVVLKHVFEQRPMGAEALAVYDPDTAAELQRLSRQLFKERFDETSQYKRNMDIHNYLKAELTKAVGVGAVAEVLQVSYNEVGTAAAYMREDQWLALIDLLVEKVRAAGGDVLADRCASAWLPAVKQKMGAFS